MPDWNDLGQYGGRTTLNFDVRLEKGAILGHEWRDAAQPYRVGPSLVIDAAGKLTADGKPLADVPIGAWFQLEIACNLGRKAAGTYNLTLSVPGQPAKRFSDLALDSPRFNRVEWLGFVSLATSKTAFYIHNVNLVLATD